MENVSQAEYQNRDTIIENVSNAPMFNLEPIGIKLFSEQGPALQHFLTRISPDPHCLGVICDNAKLPQHCFLLA